MAAQKKFGAFSGVFTPSILTILGVIMYMRLGWVVGQAGLYVTIGIILIAHIISITTGLSISSIATDKKIKTGGIYYMLSRSLGLPMGGAIGLTLFVGTALSISLYIIGFAESFLGIEEIHNFFQLNPDINSIRIVGTAIIIVLVILAFISTSLAIKTQFFILIAIILSLVSIGLGFFLNGTSGGNIHFNPIKDHDSFALIFAIFFPAVTGFTAGVAMSGDLKNPKKDIPKGTLISIVTGLIIYIGLAVGIAIFVNPETLIADNNFLVKIAWFSPLVIAGIWGATLSSALGGILGGPRILQAMSKDKITPKIFAKGYGINKEPRNALILTFLIAEAGILIGELDLIARIVSMFYIAAYGFINLSYSLESWASSDFRPTFKIPKITGIIGFIACFFVMFQIDFIAMIGATTIIILVYLLLKRKELQLDFGDVWQSVWSSIVRTSLHKIDQKEIEERNWKPNILLFSNQNEQRNKLIEFGKFLVGKHGFLSNFDIVENESAKVLFPKSKQTVQSEDTQNFKGIFTRKQSCKNFYDGVEMITKTYGFSGVVPNTTLFSWSRQNENPVRFVQTLKTIDELDMNILLMDYDKEKGFGEKKTIDIWWRGSGNNGNLALNLVRFLWLSDEWRNAELRIMIENPVNAEQDFIFQKTQTILEKLRIDADIRIINNQVEKKEIYDLIRTESITTDLIFIGIPEIEEGKEEKFAMETNKLCEDVGTIIFLKASKYFKELKLGIHTDERTQNIEEEKNDSIVQLIASSGSEIPELKLPEDTILNKHFKDFSEKYIHLTRQYFEKTIGKAYQEYEKLIEDLGNQNKIHLDKLSDNLDKIANQEENIANYLYRFTNRIFKLNSKYHKDIIPLLSEKLKNGNNQLINASQKLCESLPEKINTHRTNKSGKQKTIKINYQSVFTNIFPFYTKQNIFQLNEKHRLISMQFVVEMQKFIKQTRLSHLQMAVQCNEQKLACNDIGKQTKEIIASIQSLKNICINARKELFDYFLSTNIQVLQEISDIFQKPKLIKTNIRKSKQKIKQFNHGFLTQIPEIPKQWEKHQKLGLNIVLLQLHLLRIHLRLKIIIKEQSKEAYNNIRNTIETYYNDIVDSVENHLKTKKNQDFYYEANENLIEKINQLHRIPDQVAYKIRPLINKLPENVLLMESNTFNRYNEIGFEEAKILKISVSQLIDYIIQNEILNSLDEIAGEYAVNVGESYSNVQNTLRYISFSFKSNKEEFHDLDKHIHKQVAVIKEEKNKLNKLSTRFQLQLEERINTTAELLSVSKFIKTASNLKQYIKQQESKKRKKSLAGGIKRIKKTFKQFVDQYWYRQSRGVILAKKIRKLNNDNETRVNDLLNIYDQLKPNNKILNDLPYYYKELFFNKNHFVSDLWIGRKNEIDEAKKSIKRYQNGNKGALLILGEYNSGKTFFSQYIAHKLYKNANVFILNPPYEGSVSKQTFHENLIRSLEIEGSMDYIFKHLPEKPIIIIEDLELWWEKSPNGFDVIRLIINIIIRYSEDCLFIINGNTHSFKLINKLQKIESHFLNIIECTPFDAALLEKVIINRHHSTGLNLKIRQKGKHNLRPISMPRFFANMFNFSKGNIGIALNAWIANIYEFDGKTLTVTPTKQPNIDKLNHLENDWYLLLMLFLLHKRVNLEKLQRITLETSDKLFNKLMILKRANLIIENQNHVYELNPHMHMHIAHKIIEKEMI